MEPITGVENGAEHGNLVKSHTAWRIIDASLGNNAIPSGLSLQSASDLSGTQIVATAASRIDVTDASGNHTGPIEGFIEQNIPGSLYFLHDGLASVSLPGGQTYNITITPRGNEPVDLTVMRTASDGSVTQKIYTGIISTTQSRIRLSGDPSTQDTWQFDSSGSGTTLQPINPNLTYGPADTMDTTPPVSTVQLQGYKNAKGWYEGPVTVTINASDQGSGVQRVEYSFVNDPTLRLYTGPFTVDASSVSVIDVIAIDKAGNIQESATIAKIGPEKLFLPMARR